MNTISTECPGVQTRKRRRSRKTPHVKYKTVMTMRTFAITVEASVTNL